VTIAPSARPTVASVYLDGRASLIWDKVIQGVDQFERAHESNPDLAVTIDGDRRTRAADIAMYAGLTFLPSAACVGIAAAVGGVLHPLAGVAAVAGMGAFFGKGAWRSFETCCLQPTPWAHQTRYVVGEGVSPTPVAEPGVERLQNLVSSHDAPRHVLYLSGHGDDKMIAGMKIGDLEAGMQSTPVSHTIIDCCLGAQLEVVSRLAPWAGFVLASTHPIPAQGLPIEAMFAPDVVGAADDREAAVKMAEVSAEAVGSWSVTDTHEVSEKLLPSLDTLGRRLAAEIRQGNGSLVRDALGDTRSPEFLVMRKADLGSFLEELSERPFPAETKAAIDEAREALAATVVYQKGESGLSFRLNPKHLPETGLPEGWREFLGEAGYRFKPLF